MAAASDGGTPCCVAIEPTPEGPTVPPVEGAVEVAGAALVPAVGAGAAGAAAPPSAAAPSLTVGTWMVEPITTCASDEIPLTAATVRVVRLLAAAMDHRVSPG